MSVKILIIDDEAIIRDLLSEFLAGLGYSVVLAKSGADGLKKIHDPTVKIALVDLKLPDMDGIDVIKKMKTIRLDLATVIMTAFPTPESRSQAEKLGVTAYLTKPFNLTELQAVIQKALK